MKKQQTGFTLIELVMVIVILGILSAFALPRFANLSTDANVAVVEAGAGAAKSGAAIAHSAWLAGGATGTTVSLEGVSIDLVGGYPQNTAGGIGTAAGLNDDFTLNASGAWQVTGGAATCSFTYAAASSGVTVTTTTGGC